MRITWMPLTATIDLEKSPAILAMIEDCVHRAYADGFSFGVRQGEIPEAGNRMVASVEEAYEDWREYGPGACVVPGGRMWGRP